MRWKPTKAKIKEWLENKEDEFTQKETRGLWISPQFQKDRYLYSDLHEIFFRELPISLYERTKRRFEINNIWRELWQIVWTEQKIKDLRNIDNKWSRAIDFLFLHVKYGYIVELAIGCNESHKNA